MVRCDAKLASDLERMSRLMPLKAQSATIMLTCAASQAHIDTLPSYNCLNLNNVCRQRDFWYPSYGDKLRRHRRAVTGSSRRLSGNTGSLC